MSPRSETGARLEDAIIVDEIGIESGGYGIYRLRSLYQPIFERRGQFLHAVAVEGMVAPYLAGEQVPKDVFLAAAADDDLEFIRLLRFALPLRNLRNIEAEGIRLLIDIAMRGDAAVSLADRVRFIAGEIEDAELEPDLVTGALVEPATPNVGVLAAIAEEMNRGGMQSAIGDFGLGRWSDEQIDILAPRMARIDSEWFRQVCRDAVTVRLFESVVARLHERGVKVLVCGIEDAQQFAIALEAGADLLQGDHLASVENVGNLLLEALPVRDKLNRSDKARNLRVTHQKR